MHRPDIPRDDPIMASENDAGDALAIRLKRLKYRCWHRGTKEMDLLLGPFADARLGQMSPTQLDRFETLTNEADTDLQKWLLGQEPPPDDVDRALLAELLTFKTDR